MNAPTSATIAAHTERVQPASRNSLDVSALLVPGGGYAALTLYPQAGEATAVWVPEKTLSKSGDDPEKTRRPPELVALDSARRAKGVVRRDIRKNRGRFLWTFTFADATYDYAAVVAAVQAFLVNLRTKVGRFWFRLVPEPHPEGHGWHVHGVTNRYIEYLDVWAAWGKGHVWVGDHKKRRAVWQVRELAGYLAKYISKVVAGENLFGCTPRGERQHRHWGPQGFEPQCVRIAFRSLRQAELWLLEHYGSWDTEIPLGGDGDVPVDGWWYSFPDRCCRPLKW